MGYHSNEPDLYRVPDGMAYIRTLRTKIVETIDYIQHCRNDEEALNGWRLLCSYGIAIVSDIEQRNRLPEDDGRGVWKETVEKLHKEWEALKTSEKTVITLCRSGQTTNYSIQWDSYVGEFMPEDLDRGIRIMNSEKHNAINHTLMKFWGKCLKVIMASGELILDDKIEVPIQPTTAYTEEHMEKDITSRRLEKRQSDQKSRN